MWHRQPQNLRMIDLSQFRSSHLSMLWFDLALLQQATSESMAAIEEIVLLDALAKQLTHGSERPELTGLAGASKSIRNLVS